MFGVPPLATYRPSTTPVAPRRGQCRLRSGHSGSDRSLPRPRTCTVSPGNLATASALAVCDDSAVRGMSPPLLRPGEIAAERTRRWREAPWGPPAVRPRRVAWLLRALRSSCQLPPMTGATMVGGASGENTEVTSTSVPAAIAAVTCCAVVNGWLVRSMLPGLASTSRTRVQAPV